VSLYTQLNTLIAQLNTLAGRQVMQPVVFVPTTSAPITPTANLPIRDLVLGMSGPDVMALQRLLIVAQKGPAAQVLSASGVSEIFTQETHNALVEYQRAVRTLLPQGVFGPVTRAQMKGAGVVGVWW